MIPPPDPPSAPHTPLPWEAHPAHVFDEATIVAGGIEIGLLYCSDGFDEPTPLPGKANAEFIVQAVNCHADLVEALNDLWLWASEQRTHLDTDPVPDGLGVQVLAALAKAGQP